MTYFWRYYLSLFQIRYLVTAVGSILKGGHTDASGVYHCHANDCEATQCGEQGCGGVSDLNCNYPNSLEIVSINIGQGDATLIASPTKILLADSGETYWNSHSDASKIDEVIRSQYGENCKTIDYFINSHLHLDHIGYIQAEYNDDKRLLNSNGELLQDGDSLLNPTFKGGVSYLVNELGYTVKQSLFRDLLTHTPNKPTFEPHNGSKTYWNWRAYLQSAEGKAAMNPVTAILGKTQVKMGKVDGRDIEIDIVQVDAATPSNPNGCDPATYFQDAQDTARGNTSLRTLTASENDLSIAFILSFGKFQMFIGGDTSGFNDESDFGYRYHDTESCLADDAYIQQNYAGHLEILRVNHHGSSHSTNQHFLDTLSPRVSIFSVGDHNPYEHVSSEVLKRVLKKSIKDNKGAVYLTEAGIENTDPDNLCLTRKKCAFVADDEFPLQSESNETGDANVTIIVSSTGNTYEVQGKSEKSRNRYRAKNE